MIELAHQLRDIPDAREFGVPAKAQCQMNKQNASLFAKKNTVLIYAELALITKYILEKYLSW